MATVGGLDKEVLDLTLLDSLYANFAQFDAYVESNLPDFGVELYEYRFSSVYSADGGTYSNNQAMAQRATGWVKSANCTNILLVDNTANKLTVGQVEAYSLLFKYSADSHNDIPRNMFYTFLVGGK